MCTYTLLYANLYMNMLNIILYVAFTRCATGALLGHVYAFATSACERRTVLHQVHHHVTQNSPRSLAIHAQRVYRLGTVQLL